MIVKLHKTQDGRNITAICDADLIGKKFEEGKLQLDLSSGFYKGEEKDETEIMELIKNSYMINVVGEKSVGLCVKLGIVTEKNILRVDGISHAESILE